MPLIASRTTSKAVSYIRQGLKLRPSRHKRHGHTESGQPKPEGHSASSTAVPVPGTVATLPLWQRLGPLSRAFEAYDRSQRKRPYLTQFYSTLALYFLGDMSAQTINGEAYDPFRTLRTLIIGAGSSVPSYKWCDS